MRMLRVGFLALALALGSAASAGAAPLTLQSSVSFGTGSDDVQGSYDPITGAEFAALNALVCPTGSCTGDVFYFKISVTSGSLGETRLTALNFPASNAPQGAGYYNDGVGTDPSNVFTTATQAGWQFAGLTGNSEILVAAYSDSSLPGAFAPRFMTTAYVGSNHPNDVPGVFVVVPEPATALLAGLGLAGIAIVGRRKRG